MFENYIPITFRGILITGLHVTLLRKMNDKLPGKLHPSYFDASGLFINSEELKKDFYCV